MGSIAGVTHSSHQNQQRCHLSSASFHARLPARPYRLAQHDKLFAGTLRLQQGQALEAAALQVRSSRGGLRQIQCRKDASTQRGQRRGTNTGEASGSFLATLLKRQSGDPPPAKSRVSRGQKTSTSARDKRLQPSRPADERSTWVDELKSLGVWLDNLLPEFLEDTRVERLSYAVFSVSVVSCQPCNPRNMHSFSIPFQAYACSARSLLS